MPQIISFTRKAGGVFDVPKFPTRSERKRCKMSTSVLLQNPEVARSRPVLQAYQILHIAFTIAPIIAGLDKFTNWLVDWSSYLSPLALTVLPISGHTFMYIVGVIEVIAGLVVFFKPRFGGYLVALWLW